MDYSCRDIPMRLDIRHQPLNFDIYLSQVIDVPRTSLEEQPYNFQLEVEALERVDQIIERNRKDQAINHQEVPTTVLENQTGSSNNESRVVNLSDESKQVVLVKSPQPPVPLPTPSCPTETPLTPVKSSMSHELNSNSSNTTNEQLSSENSSVNQINLKDFEDIHYNPFDHLELQTIDELRELNLVFQASYSNQDNNVIDLSTSNSSTNHSQPLNNSPVQDSNTNPITRST